MDSPSMLSTLPLADEIFVHDGYIRVYQDIRGKYGSEGDYVVNRPPVGPLNPTKVDHITDAWDTIDWLVNRSEEHTSELQSLMRISYAVFCLKKKNTMTNNIINQNISDHYNHRY